MLPSARRRDGAGYRFSIAVWFAILSLIFTGCAVQTPRLLQHPPDDLPRRVELTQTPFFPQGDDFLCGPDSLASVLSAAGLPTAPQQLVDQLYLPGRQGTLQIEMLAAARRRGAVATVIPGRLDALMRELAAGHPVIVLQNLGLSWIPRWHYAVAIGYDLEAGHVLLRTGATERQELPLRTLEHTWGRSEFWAFVTRPPGQLPATASEEEATRALVAFERGAEPGQARAAYESGLQRWPDNLALAMGLGNTLYASGQRSRAAEVFEVAALRHRSAAAYNNLASVWLELGRIDDARRAAQTAVALGGVWKEAAEATLREVERRAAAAAARTGAR